MSTRLLTISLPSALAAALLLSSCRSQKAQSAGPPPAVPVSVAVAAREPVPLELRAIGAVEPMATVQVKSQIAGQLLAVPFAEGSTVAKGDLLFEIDPRPYLEALRQAEAATARDLAQLRQAEANLERDRAQAKTAQADARRFQELDKAGVVSRAQYDQARTSAEALHASTLADQAAIESIRASIDSDRAAVERAKLDLNYCRIHAPLSGRTGNLLVHAGNLVKANDVPLVVINQIAPIYVSFGVPEQQLAAIRRRGDTAKLPVEVLPRNGAGKAVGGQLTVIDNAVDPGTGTIRLKALVANQERALWPGQFVDVVLRLDVRNDATVVPREAVQAGQRGPFVFVVKPDQTVESRVVAVGPDAAGKTIIEKGLSPGETVVTDGQLRLFPGARVRAVPAGKIDNQAL